ncbi:hypothetical protein ACJJTC_006432 [Scirpophaga incertulas]
MANSDSNVSSEMKMTNESGLTSGAVDQITIASRIPEFCQVTDILIKPPENDKYKAQKERLLTLFEESASWQVQKLIGEMELGHQRPSQLLRRMRNLAQEKVPDDTLKVLWQSHLPTTVKGILAVSCVRKTWTYLPR